MTWQHLSLAAPAALLLPILLILQSNVGLRAESVSFSVILGYQYFYRYKELELKPRKTMSCASWWSVQHPCNRLLKIYLIKGWIPQTPTLKMNTAAASQQRKKKIFDMIYFETIKMAAASLFLRDYWDALVIQWEATQKSKIFLHLPNCKEGNQTRLKSAILPWQWHQIFPNGATCNIKVIYCQDASVLVDFKSN